MKTAEDYGRAAAKMKPDDRERFIKSLIKKEGAKWNEFKEKMSHKMDNLEAQANQLLNEINLRGNLSESISKESLTRGIFMLLCLSVCIASEYVFAHWMIAYFGLSPWETSVVSLAIVIISLEGMDFYITALRKHYPNFENHLFLIIGSIGFLLIMLMIVFGAEIRQSLYQTTTVISNSPSLDDTVKIADNFIGTSITPFMWLMILLTSAIIIIGGYSFHDAKNRLIISMSFMRLHKNLKKVRSARTRLLEQEVEMESRFNSFESDFQHGLLMEQQKMDDSVKDTSLKGNIKQNVGQYIGFIIVSPVFLMLVILLVLFLFRGMAGAETIIFLDLSMSSEASDYTGRETEFQKNVKGIEAFIQNNLTAGERIRIVGITDRSFSNPYMLLEGQIPKDKGAFGEKIAREKIKILQTWKKLNLKPTAKSTNIFDAVQLASVIFSPNDKSKKLIIFSDMREYGKHVDLESPNRIDVDRVFNEIVSNGLIPSLEGVRVWCVGVHSSGKESEYWQGMKKLWVKYFKQANAIEPIVFSMERRIESYE